MKTALLIKPGPDQQLAWRALDDGATRLGAAAELAADPLARDAELVLVVPAQRVLLHSVAFAAHERRLLRQTVPYSLEEELIDDVGDQHFALGAIAGEEVPVAVVQRQWFADWLAHCSAAGLDIKRALPEQLLLPWRPGSWTLFAQAEQWLVRVGPYQGFALEPASAALALQLLLDAAEELPERVLLCSDRPLEVITAQLPELLRGIVEVLEVAEPVLPAPGEPTLDLLQGAFARTLPWRRWWKEWKRPAIAVGIALAVQVVVMLVQHQQLQKRNVALRQQIEQTYRTVEPRGVVAEPERQLKRKVDALRGRQGGGVMPLLQLVGSAVTAIPNVKILNMTYTDRQGELRISLSAAAFKDVEALRGAIAAKGLDAQLVGSSADGDKTRAQLRVTGAK